jgi:hypothetical protein
MPSTDKGTGMFQYFIKVVPTIYESLDGAVINTNQFSVTEHYRILANKGEGSGHGLPGWFITSCLYYFLLFLVLDL